MDAACRAAVEPPRLGLFWVTPDAAGTWDVRDVFLPFAVVPEIGGFRSLDEGHAQAWARVGRGLSPEYGEYGDYPRGRVNWRAEDDCFLLLLLDPVLLRRGWRERLLARFRLLGERTLILTDTHYRSRVVPPPGDLRNA